MEQQEYFLKMQMLGQEAEKIEQQIQAIEQQMSELGAVRESLNEIIKPGKEKEILANLGKGIFVSAELKQKNLLVNVGKNTLIKKTPEETLRIIDDQMSKLLAGKTELVSKIEYLQENMQHLLLEVQKEQKSGHKHEHECDDEECECEEHK